jgi:hypothetical protein
VKGHSTKKKIVQTWQQQISLTNADLATKINNDCDDTKNTWSLFSAKIFVLSFSVHKKDIDNFMPNSLTVQISKAIPNSLIAQ